MTNKTPETSTLKKPLTVKALFDLLAPMGVARSDIKVLNKGAEAVVDGTLSLAQFTKLVKANGFKAVLGSDGTSFVNAEDTVGFVCMGSDPHPYKNTWKGYSFEVQARTKAEADASHAPNFKPRFRALWSA